MLVPTTAQCWLLMSMHLVQLTISLYQTATFPQSLHLLSSTTKLQYVPRSVQESQAVSRLLQSSINTAPCSKRRAMNIHHAEKLNTNCMASLPFPWQRCWKRRESSECWQDQRSYNNKYKCVVTSKSYDTRAIHAVISYYVLTSQDLASSTTSYHCKQWLSLLQR